MIDTILTMRASVERRVLDDNLDVGDSLHFDGYTYAGGTEDADSPTQYQEVVTGLPCYVYGNVERTIINENITTTIGDYTMLVKYDADISELDRVSAIVDSRGRDYLRSGRMRVLQDIPMQGFGPQTLEYRMLMLETTD